MPLLDPKTWQSRTLSGGEYTVTEPATGEGLGTVTLATAEDISTAARTARAAQSSWARAPHFVRAAVLRRAGDLFAAHADELRDWIVRESGSIPGKADFELHVAAQECYEAAALASRPTGQILPSEAPRLSYTRRVPVGVVGVIAPFNAPLILSIRSVAPALALGNGVVLKPDPRTAVCGGLALAAVFAEAGLPEGLLHVLPGGPEAGQALVADPQVPVISFTGSTAAGRAVGEAAGRQLKRVHLELGGNSALIVLADADIDAVISTAAWGSFFHQGQICMTTGRHLVHASLYEEYVERLAAKADSLAVGDPHREQVHLGPIIDSAQLAKIQGLVESSTARGAKLAAGGTHEKLFYRPTVLAGVDDSTPRTRRRSSARSRRYVPSRTSTRPPLSPQRDRTASPWASSPGTPRAASTSPSASPPASPTSTTRPSTTRPSRPSAGSRPPAPAPASAVRPTWRPSPTCAGRRCAGMWRRTRSERGTYWPA